MILYDPIFGAYITPFEVILRDGMPPLEQPEEECASYTTPRSRRLRLPRTGKTRHKNTDKPP